MRFLLVGDHPDGLDMAQALVATGHHQLAAYTGSARGAAAVRSRGLSPQVAGDLEEALADPAIEMVVVAGPLGDRPAQLRRALQSERHVLCVHPADQTPDIAYEAALLQGDTQQVLLPLLTGLLHPGVRRLVELLHHGKRPLGGLRLLEWESWSPGEVLLEAEAAVHKPAFPGWDVLRLLGGEITELSAYAAAETVLAGEPVLVAGRFENGGLFRMVLLPGAPGSHRRLEVIGSSGQAELEFATDPQDVSRLRWRDAAGTGDEETWTAWSPWPVLAAIFDEAVAAQKESGRREMNHSSAAGGVRLAWQDAVRALELDDAARRSSERRRASTLEYQEVSEEVGFKGTMTLVGCALLWVMLLLLVLSRWLPRLGWVFVPLLALFLALQLLRWIIPRTQKR